MILIPEIETVLILVPRTGTHSLKHAVLRKYPRSILLYRHMEADGVPAGYDRWQKIGIARNPIERLWSLYNYLSTFGGVSNFKGEWEQKYIEIQRRSVNKTFSDWILNNEVVFTSPYSRDHPEYFQPIFNVQHCLPENRKSQFIYLRPDLGTEIYQFSQLADLHERLGVSPARSNCANKKGSVPPIDEPARAHMLSHFSWDFDYTSQKELAA